MVAIADALAYLIIEYNIVVICPVVWMILSKTLQMRLT